MLIQNLTYQIRFFIRVIYDPGMICNTDKLS